MATQETPSAGLPVPQVPITFVPAKAGEVLKLGQMTIRIMEDGSHTDKTFSKNSTNIALSHKDAKDTDAKTGDYVTVPVRAPHTFSNRLDEEARFFNTFTPAFYVNYFKLLSDLADGGR